MYNYLFYARCTIIKRHLFKHGGFILQTVSPSLSKALTVDPDLIEWIGENYDSELKLSEEVKEFVADDLTIRLHSLISVCLQALLSFLTSNLTFKLFRTVMN